jgi:HD-GYP domain-containing protein (c-di-GMP phosphodiesterase class II)
MLSWTETEHEALLQVIPDQVFRLKLQDDGSVSVIGDRCGFRFTASVLDNPECNPVKEDKTEDQTSCLCRELARHAKRIIDESSRSGPVQIFEVQIDQRGQIRRYKGRAAAAAPAEIVALVTEITPCEEAELGVSGSGRVETGPDSILRQQVSQYAGDEEVIRDVSIKLNRLLEDTIKAIQSVVQKKDPSTARHQARVWKLACAIGREMGLGKTRVAIIVLAAMVHDFGKVFIPADILNKPGKLTEAEYAAVKNHAEAVFQILSTIDVFCPIADIVRQHHERMNGSGYPLGLKSEDILLEARIIAVADVVEAMLSDRPYRRALGVEVAMKEIANGRGTLYDGNAVDACIRLFTVGNFEFDADAGLPEPSVASKA